jgi:hypothetical protein
LVALLAGAAFLKPDPTGRGTHRQLGLPACLVCQMTGVDRCPSCGLTTACAWAVRGEFRQARRCHPAALPVLAVGLFALLYCAAIAVTGRQWLVYELSALTSLLLVTGIGWTIAFWRLSP